MDKKEMIVNVITELLLLGVLIFIIVKLMT